PEAHLLKAVIYFNSCQMDNAMAAVQSYHRQYDPVREELAKLVEREADANRWPALLDRLAAGTFEASRALRAVLQRALGDRELVRARQEIESVAAEQAALARQSRALRDSTLGDRVRQDLAVARSFAEAEAGALAQARAQRLLNELQEVANQ